MVRGDQVLYMEKTTMPVVNRLNLDLGHCLSSSGKKTYTQFRSAKLFIKNSHARRAALYKKHDPLNITNMTGESKHLQILANINVSRAYSMYSSDAVCSLD